MYARYPFARPRKLGTRVPIYRRGMRLSDSINSPGFPGSNVLYGRLSGVSGMGFDWGGLVTNVTGAVKTVTETAVPAYMQYRVFSENLKRSRQDKPALETDQYAPSMRVQIEPGRDALYTAGGIGVGALALGAVALFLLLRK